MRSLLFPLFTAILSQVSLAQSSTILMQRCLGNSSTTNFLCVAKTNDGGYVAGGTASASGGDVSGYHGGPNDGWIVKFNQLGGIEWQRCFGGSSNDVVYDIVQMSDGSYVIAGASSSYDGDITSTHSSPSNNTNDAFIAKLSATGEVEWTRCYGGSNHEEFKKVIATPDGGFLCAGSAQSGDGDVIGYHTGINPLHAKDVWVVKIDASGTLQWNKAYGDGYTDQAVDLVPTIDGNYIIGAEGAVFSAGNYIGYGGSDVWLIKIDPVGNIIWQKVYGGSQDEHAPTIIRGSDGGFVMAFLTYSNDGMCSHNNSGGAGITDIGMIKIAEDGSVVWSNCFGGGSYEWYGNFGMTDDKRGGLLATADGGYLVCGSASSVDGEVTGLHGPISLGSLGDNYDHIYYGNEDAWVVKVNASGTLQWQKALGGTYHDIGQVMAPGPDAGQFIIVGNVDSNDGDISGLKSTENGNQNAWIAKVKAGNTITGVVFIDRNSNGVQDASEPGVNSAMVTSSSPYDTITTITHNGQFINVTDTGQFVTTVSSWPYYTVMPSSITTPNHSTYYNSDTISFALQPIPGKTDLVVNAFTPSFIKLGRDMQYKIVVRNVGTVNIPSGVLRFVKDSRLFYKSSNPTSSSVVADTITWNYSNLDAGDTLSMLLTMTVQTPPVANLKDTLENLITVSPVNSDLTPANDTVISKDVVIGAFDPNNKTEIHGGIISSDFASSGGILQYTIRFQNTGNDTAFNVIVKDTLDTKLDWGTVQLISSSHPVNFSITNGNQLTWTFPNINLVDSTTNEPLSHGYVVYEVKPKNTVVVNDVIHNDASIYFDYNLPVETADASVRVQNSFVVLPTQLVRFSGNKQNEKVTLLWSVSETDLINSFEIERSIDGRNFSAIETKFPSLSLDYRFDDDISGLLERRIYYRLRMLGKAGNVAYSAILVVKNNSTLEVFNVYPNPAHQSVFLSYTSTSDGNIMIDVIDASGKTVLTKKEILKAGETVIQINEFSGFPAGNYLVCVRQYNDSSLSKWITKVK